MLRFAKYYTPLVVLICVLLIVVPAIMRKRDLKVRCKHTALSARASYTLNCCV